MREDSFKQLDDVIHGIKPGRFNMLIGYNIKFCQQCQSDGKKSSVRSHGCTRTLLHCEPFYDEDGRYHHHDSNTTKEAFSCSNGHNWVETYSGSCWCGWGQSGEKNA